MPDPKIVILTPVKDATEHLDQYFELLRGLGYPHSLLSLGILEGDSTDGTYDAVAARLPQLRQDFASAHLFKRDYNFQFPPGVPRWAPSLQEKRRSILARSRNYLTSVALQDADYALWLDVDVVEYPSDIIQRLLSTGKDIVHPHCVKRFGGKSFDRNAWTNQGRSHMESLRHQGDLVSLDAVGGTMLLVRADLHREGLVFPPCFYGRLHPKARRRGAGLFHWLPFVVNRLVPGEMETEGLGLMAHDMGITPWGMPNLEIRHKDA